MSDDPEAEPGNDGPEHGGNDADGRRLWPWVRTILDGLADVPCLNVLAVAVLGVLFACLRTVRSGTPR